jgi:hypothetical protein
MTPEGRDRNLDRVRRITAWVAGIAVAATGAFAGLAAAAPRHASKTTIVTTRKQTTTPTPTTTTTPAVSVTPTQSAPVASSGGS